MGVKLMTLDIIIHGGYIITMEGNGTGVINDGAVGIKGNEIVAVGNTNDIINILLIDILMHITRP